MKVFNVIAKVAASEWIDRLPRMRRMSRVRLAGENPKRTTRAANAVSVGPGNHVIARIATKKQSSLFVQARMDLGS
jgi:hypothetical protein